MTETVTIEKIVHGGQGLGTLADGRRVFVWGALPGEKVLVRLTKNKHKLAEAVTEQVIDPSPDRIPPRDEAFMSTSPWQIMSFSAENKFKQHILAETLQREHITYQGSISMIAPNTEWQYRNKMEYSFWADDKLDLALYNRGTHRKIVVPGSSIAMPAVDQTARAVVDVLNSNGIRGSQLKTVIVRANQAGESVAALFVKDESFPELSGLASVCRGVTVCYSTPKSPASVLTKELYRYGDVTLTDTILDTPITYDVHSFFQVNLAAFEPALTAMKDTVQDQSYIDMYSGVGTIGLSLGSGATLVESDKHNNQMARHNARDTQARVVEATAETTLDYIDNTHVLIVDPPRAGLHAKVTQRIVDVLPPKVVYLSCNPTTQARDLATLQSKYKITSVIGYNFFPRTPHIESLAVLERA